MTTSSHLTPLENTALIKLYFAFANRTGVPLDRVGEVFLAEAREAVLTADAEGIARMEGRL